MRTARVRIVNVRPKPGSNIHIFPGGKQAISNRVLAGFDEAVAHTRDLYASDFGGYALIAWDMEGRFRTSICTEAPYPRMNDLPTWAAEAIRRWLAEHEARNLLPG